LLTLCEDESLAKLRKRESLRHLVLTVALILVLCAPAHAQVSIYSQSPSPAPTVTPAPGAKGTVVRLRADHIVFYYDRYLVEADGNVQLQTSNGMTITGDAFSMDLRLNRFLIAGHVHLRSAGGNIDGAAIADLIDFDRIYFVPVITKPDRWTYENGDFTHPLKGRQMPGDVFYFPDLAQSHRSLSARTAIVSSKEYVKFANVRAYFLNQGAPMPSYYVYFGASQDLAENSLSGANFDATWNFAGNANSISALHFRYDYYNNGYVSFEQHLAGNDPHEYAVFSVNPATKDDKYWNLITGEHIGSKFEIDTFTQLYTYQKWLTMPSASAQSTYVTMTQAFHRSYIQLFFNATNYNLIGPNAPYSPNHPNFGQLTWYSYNNQLAKSPLYLQTRVGMGYNHDSYGLQDYGDTLYTTLWNQLVGFTTTLANVKIGDRNQAYKLLYLNASMDWQRQWYTVPHHINTQTTTISLSRQWSRFVSSYASFNVLNTSDLYLQGGYAPSAPLLPDGTPYTPFESFRGAATLRTTTLSTTYSASPNLVATVAFSHHQDFPSAFPGLFSPPPLNAIGQYTYSNYLGQPPWQLYGELRARLLPHLTIDLQRTYFFHYGNLVWSPTFVVQFST
jgi:hypothetical protein